MMTLRSANDFAIMQQSFAKMTAAFQRRVIVCAGTGCVANNALLVLAELERAIAAAGLSVTVELSRELPPMGGIWLSRSGCQGFCQMGPLLAIEPDGLLYTQVKSADVQDIVTETLIGGRSVERLLFRDPNTKARCHGPATIPFYQRQHRMTLALCGRIDPESLDEYVANGGYESARKAFIHLQPEAICEEILAAGLRGRGGGGFPTGRKWQLTLAQKSAKKYVICNGDEGDPGAFMDRSVMEGDPHCVIEGLLIAGRAVGADEAYIYVRAEYPLAVKRLRTAVASAEAAGLLGPNVFGSGKSFIVHIMEGAGAFVCGEETALMSSIEGRRGMPMPKPPFPAQSGLWGQPTVINNVETLATVPLIIAMGAAAFRQLGNGSSAGTKTFALTGHVANTGLIEVPLGTTLREIVFAIGGGVTTDSGRPYPDGFKAVQIGGPSGGCLTSDHLDMPLDFDALQKVGAMIGSGGLVVVNAKSCMVKLARFFMQFTQNESCGKCVVCREGTKQMLNLLDDIISGKATMETLDLIEELAHTVQVASLCGLGKTAPNPVLSTLKYFRDEYIEHIVNKRCPTGQCAALRSFVIDPVLCKKCSLCMRHCPVGAIGGSRETGYVIDQEKCIKCGACVDACKFKAIKLA